MLLCDRCGGEIKVHAHAQAKSCTCVKCGRLYDLRGGKLTYKKTFQNPVKPFIPVGTVGKLDEIKWLVCGYAVKKDSKYGYFWREYTLFNPRHGYSYFSEYDGHWMYLMSMNTYPGFEKGEVKYNGATFYLYSKYKPVLTYAEGEFPYDISDDSKLQIEEYINPPEILSHEYQRNQVEWLRGWYLQPAEVAEAFKCKTLPEPEGIGVIQPQTFSLNFKTTLWFTILAALILFGIQLLIESFSEQKMVFSRAGTVNDSTTNKMIVSSSFTLSGGKKNLVYWLFSDVDNSWMETQVQLVNEQTNEVFAFEHGVEFYHGYDGGYWSEGKKTSEKILEAVPGGVYHLLITPVKNIKDASMRYEIKLVRDVPRWSNFWKALLVLAIFPVIQFYRTQNFEKQRWMHSDYTPFDE